MQAEEIQWNLIGPGTRGTLHGPAFHPTNPKIFAIGIDMGLHFITRDGGLTWDILGKNVTSKYKYAGYPGYRGAHQTVFDPKNPNIIWAGSQHGLYKSEDGGENWEFLFGGDASYFIGNIELDSTDPNIAYAGSGQPGAGYFQNWVNGDVIYKTVDGGKSWETINPLGEDGQPGNAWARILTDPNSFFKPGKGHQRIFALRHPQSKTTPGLIISEDYGSTWKREKRTIIGVSNPPEFNYLTLVSDHNKTILFASMLPAKKGDKLYGGIYRSDDLGKTWVEKNNGLEKAIGLKRTKRLKLIKIASTPADPNILFCVVNDRVFKSTDRGESWQQILYPTGRWYTDISDFDGKYAEYLLQKGEGNWDFSHSGIVGDFHSIVMAPGNADYVIITGKFGGVMTADGGKSWRDLGFEYGEESSVYDRALKKFGPMTRPSTFTHKRRARPNFQIIVPNDIALDPFSANIAIPYEDEGLQISRDGGSWWEWAYWGILAREAIDARAIVYDPDVKERLFVGTMGKVDLERLGEKAIWKLYQSDDGGVTFNSFGPDFMPSHQFIKDNFNLKDHIKKGGSRITLGVKDILIDPSSPPARRTIYIAYSTGVYKTVDGGKTWKNQIQFNLENIKDFGNDKYYLKFEMNPKNNLEIYLATYDDLYKTSDGGECWEKIAPELFGTIKSLALAKSDPAVIYVVATKSQRISDSEDSHLWKSTDAGKTWKKLDGQQTQFVTVHPEDKNIVYRALYARDVRYEDTGLFRSKNGGETWEKINPHLPMSFQGGFKRQSGIVFDPKDAQHFYVVTWCGIYEGVVKRNWW